MVKSGAAAASEAPEEENVEPELIRPEDAAEKFGIGRTKVYHLMRTGQLESVKIGGPDASPPT